MIRHEASGETMVMMCMEMDNIVVPHPRVEDVVMPGRVTGLLRDRFSGLQEVLLRVLPVRITTREGVTVDIAVVGAVDAGGIIADRRRLRQLLTKRSQYGRPITLPRSSLPRQWRW